MKKTLLALLFILISFFCISCSSSHENAISEANKVMDTLSYSEKMNYMGCYGEGEYDKINNRIYYYVHIVYPDAVEESAYSSIIKAKYFFDARKAVRDELLPVFSELENFPHSVYLYMTIYTSDGYQYDSATGWSD